MATDAYSYAVLALSPTVYYRLDEVSGTVCADSSGNGHNMVYGATMTHNVAGLLSVGSNGAVSLTDPTQEAAGCITSAARVTALESTNALTVALWFKSSTVGVGNTYTLITYGSDSASPWAQFNINFSNASSQAVFAISSISTAGGSIASVAPIVANGTYFIVGTYDGANFSLYLNGVIATQAGTGSITGYTTPYGLTIGNDAGFVDNMVQAVVDEVSVWGSTALTAAQIATLYHSGTAAAVFSQANSGAFSATGFACTLAAAPASGDTLLIGISTYTAGAFTTPTGWSLVASGVSGTENLYVYGKISAGTETSVTITATSPHGNWSYLEFSNGPALISSLVAGTAGTASTSATTSTTTVVPTTAAGTVVSFHGARSTSALTTLTDTSSKLTVQAALAATTSFGSIAVEYSQAALPASTYTEHGVWNASCTSMVDIQVWIPSPIPPSWPTPYQNYQRAAIIAQ
jgi:hypothetical protein